MTSQFDRSYLLNVSVRDESRIEVDKFCKERWVLLCEFEHQVPCWQVDSDGMMGRFGVVGSRYTVERHT